MQRNDGYQKLDQQDNQTRSLQIRKTREDHANARIIQLALPKELSLCWSSDDYADTVGTILGPLDVGYTWSARYPGVIETVTSSSSQMGWFIDYTAEHPGAALLFYLVLIGASAYNVSLQAKQREEANKAKRGTYRRLLQKMGLDLEPEPQKDSKSQEESKSVTQPPPLSAAQFNAKLQASVEEINLALAAILKEEGSSSRYERFEIELPEAPAVDRESKEEVARINSNDIRLVCEFKAPKKADDNKSWLAKKMDALFLQDQDGQKPSWFRKYIINKAIKPLYNATGLSAFTYWIMWISAAVGTGVFADAGIFGLSTIAAFGVPLLAALPYVGIKIRNYFKNRDGVSDEQARLAKMAENDKFDLFEKALHRVEYVKEIRRLRAEKTTLDAELKLAPSRTSARITPVPMPSDAELGINRRTEAVVAGYTTIVNQVGILQYNAWIVSDFLKVGPSIALAAPFGEIVGGILIAAGLLFGIREAYRKWQAAKTSQPVADANAPKVDLKKIYAKKKEELDQLKDECKGVALRIGKKESDLSPILSRPLPTMSKPASRLRRIYNCFDWGATGIFFSRLFFTNAAIYLPFVALTTLNPVVTLSILAVSGIAFIAAKMYQADQKQKELTAREHIAGIQAMDEQISVAKMTKENFETNEKILQLKSAPAPAKTAAELTQRLGPATAPIDIPSLVGAQPANDIRPNSNTKAYSSSSSSGAGLFHRRVHVPSGEHVRLLRQPSASRQLAVS